MAAFNQRSNQPSSSPNPRPRQGTSKKSRGLSRWVRKLVGSQGQTKHSTPTPLVSGSRFPSHANQAQSHSSPDSKQASRARLKQASRHSTPHPAKAHTKALPTPSTPVPPYKLGQKTTGQKAISQKATGQKSASRLPKTIRSRSNSPSLRSRALNPSIHGSANPKVKPFKAHKPLPLWLRTLFGLQQGSGVLALGVGALTLITYASIVYAQQSWGKAYRELEQLQQQELQLSSAHEMLKQNLAQQAEQSDLIPPSTEAVIVVEPLPTRPAELPEEPESLPSQLHPMGY